MSTEPSLDHAALLDVVRTAFGLDVTTLTFLPDGTAPAFRADGPFVRVFVKVMPPTTYGDQVTERALFELPLVRALRSSGTLPRVPEPLITLGGEPLAVLDGHRVFAYRWIDAVNTGKDWNAAAPERAVLLRRLHAGTAAIMSSTSALPMPPEDFALPFEPQLTESLHTLSCVPPDARPGLHALHELLLPHVDAILALLTRAQAYAARTRPRPRSFVVCHTDAHGGNVMRDAAGHLWIIDWETARLAPPEHDLWILHARLP
ncbi:aminoglycoside phosphotransferase family protein [Deinococcus sp.]|uniref:aminoglycoside phosphotransferase family protein n=1 Tax=Deinococcus sp. TaxID=47478 RepID=UPI002869E8B3|nr:aminoglycoside phosphotransferase family protein [Deinococcus sp.]